MKINLSDLSILHRVYLGFAVLIGVLIGGSYFNYANQNELNNALTSVTEQASPIVLLANKLEVSLLSTNKRLTDVLSEKDPEALNALSLELETSRTLFKQAIDEFKKQAKQQTLLTAYVAPLEKSSNSYLEDTDGLATKKAQVLALLAQTNKAKSEFQTFLPLYKSALDDMQAKTDDSYVEGLFRALLIKQSPIEVSTLDALNQSKPSAISAALTRNRNQVADLNKAIADLKMEEPNLENNAGLYIKSFLLNTTGEKGLLSRYLQLVTQQGELENKARNANQQVSEVQEQLAKVQQAAQTLMEQNIENANKTLATGRMQLLGSVVMAIIFAISIALQLAKSIRTPLRQLMSVLNAVTQGDMTSRVHYQSNNEFGQLGSQVNILVEQMGDVLKKLALAASQLNHAAHDNRTTAERSRKELELQRQETASVAAAMTEMEASVREVAQAATQTLDQVLAVEKASEAGRSIMATNISTTHQLANKLSETGKVIGEVNNMSGNIGNILDVIRSIAEQTNLLALNAAIEAARAGDHGRGFAVVADEVRTLARRTADSTAEIRNMIEGLQQAVQRAVRVMHECSGEMESSVQQSSNANGAMEEIQAIVTAISDMSSQIAAAAEEQEATSAEIAANINRISEISDSNYEGIQEVANTSHRLDELALQQQQLVNRFQL
ncbi:MAG: methyl-accepting chemotaxis protein [Aeromonadaceae bacterium]